jgi:hypothetical protein
MTTNPLLAPRPFAPRGRVCLAALVATLMGGPALAQSDAMTTAPAAAATPVPAPLPAPASGPGAGPAQGAVADGSATPSQNMVINLIHLLVKQGVITQQAADGLVKQAEDEAIQARVAAAGAPPSAANLPPPAPGVVRVPYVPQVVRNEIRDEIKQDVMAQAQAEGWANKNVIPDWINRIEWSGDVRFRDQFLFYGRNNVQPYIDFQTFNSKGPTDVNSVTNPNGIPFLNTTTNRLDQMEILAHIGMKAKISDAVSVTVRLATGADNSPQFTGQLLGNDFGKKDIWLDQAFIALTPVSWGAAFLGRMPDPFLRTDLVFDDYTNFEGAAVSLAHDVGPQGLQIFGAGGAFPVDYSSTSFPTDAGVKEDLHTKWLYGAQVGASYQPDPSSWLVKGAIAYYAYQNIKGQLSEPCELYNGNTQCSTDWSAPSFMQKGNTLFLIRQIVPDPSNPLNYAQPQLVGLAYGYDLLDVNTVFEMPLFNDTRFQLKGDYVRNLAYDPHAVLTNALTQPVNNYGACPVTPAPSDCVGPYESGNNAWMIRATIGNLLPHSHGDWSVSAGYKYIEPDAVLDAFNDPNFHYGGTNARGYFIFANYYFANNAWLTAKWYSANEVDGPPLAIDLLQLELNTRF